MSLTFTTNTAAIPEGYHEATLTALEERESENGTYRRWVFAVTVDGKEVEQYANSSMALGPRAKAYQWASALLGHKPEPGEAVELIGRRCTLQIQIDEESGYSRVAAVLPLMAQQPKADVSDITF